MDTETEMTILRNIRQKSGKDRSHHHAASQGITYAGRILYLRDGSIAEQGTHEELMGMNGEYAALYAEQESIEALNGE